MKALNWKEGFKLLSEFVILVIETFQGQICHITPLWKELFEEYNCQLLQCLKYGLKEKSNSPSLQVGPIQVIDKRNTFFFLGGGLFKVN